MQPPNPNPDANPNPPALPPSPTPREAELAILHHLHRLWLPHAVPEHDADHANFGDGDTGDDDASLQIREALQALDRIIKLNQRRSRLLGLELKPETEAKHKAITLDQFLARLQAEGKLSDW